MCQKIAVRRVDWTKSINYFFFEKSNEIILKFRMGFRFQRIILMTYYLHKYEKKLLFNQKSNRI